MLAPEITIPDEALEVSIGPEVRVSGRTASAPPGRLGNGLLKRGFLEVSNLQMATGMMNLPLRMKQTGSADQGARALWHDRALTGR